MHSNSAATSIRSNAGIAPTSSEAIETFLAEFTNEQFLDLFEVWHDHYQARLEAEKAAKNRLRLIFEDVYGATAVRGGHVV